MLDYSFGVRFFTATNNLSFSLTVDNVSNEYILDFWKVFGADFIGVNNNFQIKIESPQKNNAELQKRIGFFVDKYKAVAPAINRLKSSFARLEDNEWFLLLPSVEIATKEKYELEKLLNQFNGSQPVYSNDLIEELFGDVLENYEVKNFDLTKNSKIKVGEGRKEQRVCRFCKASQPQVSFKNEGHAISEALGNKKLILNEECDACNSFFDENIERDFINYHDVSRLIFNIKNKENKTPKIKGKNFSAFKDNKTQLNVFVTENSMQTSEQGVPSKITLNTGEKVALQTLYKALCKFALSIIDTEDMQYFDKTIDWLKGRIHTDKLPRVGLLFSNKIINNQPEITVYQRNNTNKSIPFAVGEFKFAAYLYIFIIPFSSKDDLSFVQESEYEDFLNCFRHYRSTKAIDYQDYSSNIARKLVVTINLEQIKKEKK